MLRNIMAEQWIGQDRLFCNAKTATNVLIANSICICICIYMCICICMLLEQCIGRDCLFAMLRRPQLSKSQTGCSTNRDASFGLKVYIKPASPFVWSDGDALARIFLLTNTYNQIKIEIQIHKSATPFL